MEIILQRLADFMERAESLKRKVRGAMIYPIVVVMVAVGILTFIMIKIVPTFEEMFMEFGLELPTATLLLIAVSNNVVDLLVPDPDDPAGDLSVHQTGQEVQTRPHGLGHVHAEDPRLRARWSKRTCWPAPRERSERWWPVVCRSWKG